MKKDTKPIVNPYVVLREEFDDWAVLYDPDTGRGFGLNPTGVYVWKLLDGEHTLDEIAEKLHSCAEDVNGDTGEHVRAFIDALVAGGLAWFGEAVSYRERSSHAPLSGLSEDKPLAPDSPKLVNLNSRQAAYGACMTHGSGASGDCGTGVSASGCCTSGTNRWSSCCYSGGCADAESSGCCISGSCGNPDSGSGCNCGYCAFSCYGGSVAKYYLSCTSGDCP